MNGIGLLILLIMPLVYSRPLPFTDAAVRREIQSILPTNLSSDELSQISSDILERGLFSAHTPFAEYLQTVSDVLDRYLRGELSLADARSALREKLAAIGYQPSPDDKGTLKDLSSFERLDLVIKTNADMARGYGVWMQGQNPQILDHWPAQELYRGFNRRTHRQWSGDDRDNIIKGEPVEGRWIEEEGQVFDGRMIALKNASIWTRISRFHQPYPPFDFNSGMVVRDITRKVAMQYGLIDRDTQIQPETRDFNLDLKLTPDIRNQELRKALVEEGYSFDGDVLTP